MKKYLVLIALTIVSMSTMSCAPHQQPQQQDELASEPLAATSPIETQTETPVTGDLHAAANLSEYDYLDPQHIVPTTPLTQALTYFKANAAKIKNQNYITVIDMSQNSSKKRMYVINMKTGAVNTYLVAHGKGSDTNNDGIAEKFSNSPGSNATSLGFYLTGVTYSGSHGLSLRLHGLQSTNSNAYSRAVVMHGADYVNPSHTGRSWGCPAVEMKYRSVLFPVLKDSSLLYIYKK